ncbi:protein-glutamate O-methyltransferase CheR [Sporomusa malonica]|uniref:protein-glutamate O-methyltransferase n=2 Tax=Sporomusa malonica TaxID=112901 RepID=A0A1W2DKI2_9FIRM|nr:MCP methyltransferase, CheR-type [Sporomusa malonica]
MLAITDKEFTQLASYIKLNYGIHLPEHKKTLVVGRLQNLLLRDKLSSFSEYYDQVINDKTGKSANLLVNLITTNHTFFMRESDHFVYFKEKVLPYLSRVVQDRDLRIWSAGCSSGEEPYTVAMFLDEYFGANKKLWDTKILATDISSKVLETAQKGIYSNEALLLLPKHWQANYFEKIDDESSRVVASIRQEIIFRKFNLINPVFPFKKKFHVIFCRNVMIYFDAQTKNALINAFYASLVNGGYLFIGHSESVNREMSKFQYVMPAVYRKEL